MPQRIILSPLVHPEKRSKSKSAIRERLLTIKSQQYHQKHLPLTRSKKSTFTQHNLQQPFGTFRNEYHQLPKLHKCYKLSKTPPPFHPLTSSFGWENYAKLFPLKVNVINSIIPSSTTSSATRSQKQSVGRVLLPSPKKHIRTFCDIHLLYEYDNPHFVFMQPPM